MKNASLQVPSITWTQLAIASAAMGDQVITILLREQSPPASKRLAGLFRVTAESRSMLYYDCAGMDEFRAQAAFDANIKLARRRGYSVNVRYFDRP